MTEAEKKLWDECVAHVAVKLKGELMKLSSKLDDAAIGSDAEREAKAVYEEAEKLIQKVERMKGQYPR